MTVATFSDLLDTGCRLWADVPVELQEFIQLVMFKEAAEWNRIVVEHSEIGEAYARGRAHALAEILGDQQKILALLDRRLL